MRNKPELRTTPWLVSKAIEKLEKVIKSNSNIDILEFGVGGSTIWFMNFNNVNLISFEHDKAWFNRIDTYLKTNKPNSKNYKLILEERPYSNKVLDYVGEKKFDIILIDGRDRVLCAEKVKDSVKDNGILMLDNSERLRYKPIYTMLKNWKLEESFCQWKTSWWTKNDRI
jgi:predicted O-methyltransferase YrrM